MEIDFCQQFYENFPPKELIEDFFNLIDEIENAFILTFKDVINKLKNDNSSNINNNIEKNDKIFNAEISSNKKQEQKSFCDINLLIGNCFTFPYEEHIPFKNAEDRFLVLIEISFEDISKAQETLDKINKNIIPFLHTFPYYISFKKVGGDLNFFRIENNIIVCLSRMTQTLLTFKKLLYDCQFNLSNPGLTLHLNISSAFNLYDMNEDEDEKLFLSEISSFIIKLNMKLTQFGYVIKRLSQILEVNEYETEEQKLFFKKLAREIKLYLSINKGKIKLDLEPTNEMVKSLLLSHIFGVDLLLDDYIDKKIKDKEMYDFLVQVVIKLAKKFDIDITENQLFVLKMNLIDKLNKINMKICLGKERGR